MKNETIPNTNPMPAEPGHDYCGVMALPTRKTTLRDRLRHKLFPFEHGQLPEAPATHKDVIHTTTFIQVSFLDRLRLLFSGRITVASKIVCENVVGDTKTKSQFNVLPPKCLEQLD